MEQKFSALCQYRRARGLCDRCAEKWSHDHRCAPQVQLHAMQEVWDLMSCSDQPMSKDDTALTPPEQESEQLFMALSKAAVTGVSSPRTMQFSGLIQGISIRILIDSGSTHSFLADSIAIQLSGISPLASAISVQVAGGGLLMCHSELVNASWSIQDVQFLSTLRVLPLQSYDLIVGMDWLEMHSPMQVHWKQKWLSIPNDDKFIVLQGLFPEVPDGVMTESVPLEGQRLLSEFEALFAEPTELPPPRHCDHEIPLIAGAQPVNVRPYAPALKSEIEKQVSDMLSTGVIQPSTSSFSSPVLLVKKKDQSWRFCVDYRFLNALTVKSKFPILVIDELLDELAHASWFSCLDMRAGFHQIRLKPGEEYKTAFQTHFGHIEFTVMAFGLTGAPGTFQFAVNGTLAPALRKFALVFFDDILVYSASYEDHLVHLRAVFELLQHDQWKIKRSKCKFAQRQVAYLGHVVSSKGVATDPAKIEVVLSWPVPSNVKELRSFLGLAGYYRKFVRHFGVIARPLNDLLRKHTPFVWTADHTAAFEILKQALASAPVLALPDFSKPFAIETNASAEGVGAMLIQCGHPLAFLSKPLGPRNRGLSTYEKEYLAILIAVDQWRHYLQAAEFLTITDHRSLSHLNEQRLHTPWQQKVFAKFLGLQYRIVYRKGSANNAADALSRRPHDISQSFALSAAVPSWLADVSDGYQHNFAAQSLIAKLTVASDSVPHFTFRDGVLRYKNRIWLGNNLPLQSKILSEFHSSPVGSHSGFPVTYARLKQYFAWPGMKTMARRFVHECTICQQAKLDRARYPGLLQPLPVPIAAWHVITMDFIEGLPRSNSFNCILVVVDKFSRFGHFIPLRHPFTALSVARVFMTSVYKLHGLPEQIVSDRDRIFTSALWKELFRLAGVQLNMSSAYHPQSDGQTERVNQCMETFLRCFVHACPSRWSDWIHLVEFWYNASHHSALGRSPFEVLYGRAPRQLGILPSAAEPITDLSSWLCEREVMNNLVRQHLQRA
ncbi:LOW QUALITY PROTEIN: hypothetical protein U9M48_041292 [Paspalum notatum var. saurae]|uniref:Reverse transcriptase n=1 Tax=Paspalum notatum var. saurae TaxID=547442 RepID=A0AAQ3UQ15_PASNO